MVSQPLDAQLPNVPLLNDVAGNCCACSRPLCLRQQVLNLALGNVEEVYCLPCLGRQSDRTALEVLNSLKPYIEGRNCFAKQWRLYLNESNCPDRHGCHPQACFISVGE